MTTVTVTQIPLIDSNGNIYKLCSLPNGRYDELVIDSTGLETLYKRTEERTITSIGPVQTANGIEYAELFFDSPTEAWESEEAMYQETGTIDSIVSYCALCSSIKEGIYIGKVWNTVYIYNDGGPSTTFEEFIGQTIISRKPLTVHTLSTIQIPSLTNEPFNFSILGLSDEEGEDFLLSGQITYRRDLNKVINNIEEAIADLISNEGMR